MKWLRCQSGTCNQVHDKGSQVCLVSAYKIVVLEVTVTSTVIENNCNVGPGNVFSQKEHTRLCLLL